MFASIFHPILVKATCLISPPIQMRGGMIYDLYKNKGTTSVVDSYRDIMLANESSKTMTATIRPQLNDVAKKYITNTQYGSGLNHGCTESAHLYVKACIDYSTIKNILTHLPKINMFLSNHIFRY